MKFTKMHGAGNDYVYVNCFAEHPPDDLATLAEKMSHRRFGVGADGLILIRPSQVADARMQMLNADGTQAEMCGNGIRCLAKYVYDHAIARKNQLKIETDAGVLDLELEVGADDQVRQVTVDMGAPRLEASEVPTTLAASGQVVEHLVQLQGKPHTVTCVSMGNPHCVMFVESASDDMVLGLGPIIEKDPRFPHRTNVEFVEVISRTEVRQRTWERGSGETWACGTGASAVCVAGVLTGRTDRKILNHLLGGDLTLNWDQSSGHVMMTGGAAEVFHGEWTVQ